MLQLGGQDLLTRPYADRRAFLEQLFTDHALTAPWTLVPTTDLAEARERLQTWTDVSGAEGIVIKPLTSKYLPAYRGGWTKIRRRDTTEAVIGAITGTLTLSHLLVLGSPAHLDPFPRPLVQTGPITHQHSGLDTGLEQQPRHPRPHAPVGVVTTIVIESLPSPPQPHPPPSRAYPGRPTAPLASTKVELLRSSQSPRS